MSDLRALAPCESRVDEAGFLRSVVGARLVSVIAGRRRGRMASRLAAAVTLTVAAAAAAAPLASAAPQPGYGSIGIFAAGGGVTTPRHIAVDDATGNLLEADYGTNTIQVFAPDLSPGGTATLLTSFAVPNPTGIAIDQTSHAVYVSEGAPSNKIVRFTTDGAPTPTYTADLTFPSPALGTGPCGLGSCPIGSFDAPLAVDPTTHDLLVGDNSNKRVSRYTSTGAFVRMFDGAGTDGVLHDIVDIAVSTAKTYVIDHVQGAVADNNLKNPIRQFTAQGVYEQSFGDGAQTSKIAIDPQRDRLVGVGRTSLLAPAAQLSVYAANGDVVARSDLPVPSGPGSEVQGAAVGGSPQRLYASTDPYQGVYGASGIDVFAPAPAVETKDVASSNPRSAELSGVVNPEGTDTGAPAHTTAHLEYSLDQGATWTALPDLDVGDGDADVPITGNVTGLLPHKSYPFRLVATDTQTTVTSLTATVTTADEVPTVVTGAVSDIATDSATVLGRVTPLGIQTTYYFEYGESTAYGSRVPLTYSGVAGNGYDPRTVSRSLSGLKPGTLYHYRLVAVNGAGTTYGGDATLTTDPGGVARRGYEMVSPMDKEGVPVDQDFTGARTNADGTAMVYATRKTALPGTSVANFVPRLLSTRDPLLGWSSSLLDLPEDNLSVGFDLFFSTIAVSDDLTRAAVVTRTKLSPSDGAVEGAWNLYIREPAAHRDIFVASDPKIGGLAGEQGSFHLVGSANDLSTLVFNAAADGRMYEAVEGVGLRLVSRMPDGTVATDPASDAVNLLRGANQVSDDGSRIYLQIGGGDPALYLRQNGTTTIPISVSHRVGASPNPVSAWFLGASVDGRYVEFVTPGPQAGLTPTAPDSNNSAYVYDVQENALTYLASDVSYPGLPVMANAARGSLYYQSSAGDIYYAHDGVVATVALTAGAPSARIQASPDGQHLAFLSTARLTAYDNAGVYEVYVYDAQTNSVSCASCRTDEGRPTGNAQMGQLDQSDFNRYFSRMILNDGTAFFDTPDPLVNADVNGTRDVYSYRNGRVTLISRGTHPTNSQFAEATADGSNVFFVTDDRLVGQDQDDTADMYDARVGGGIDAQSPKPGPAPCGGPDCQESTSGPTTADVAPTQRTDTATTKPAGVRKTKVAVLRSSATATTLTLVVQVSGRGRIRITGARVRTTSRSVAGAGKYTLKVPLSPSTRAAHRARRTVKVAVTVSVLPPFAAATTTKFTRTLGK